MAEEIIVYPTRGHLLKLGDRYFKLNKEEKSIDGRDIVKQRYIEVDPEQYRKQVKDLAEEIGRASNLNVSYILFDALRDLPLERVGRIREALEKEKAKVKPKKDRPVITIPTIRRSSGHCVELKIGDEYLVIRE